MTRHNSANLKRLQTAASRRRRHYANHLQIEIIYAHFKEASCCALNGAFKTKRKFHL
jgi:hypothetical protein